MPSFMEWRYVVETSKDGVNWTYNDAPFDDKAQAIVFCVNLKVPNKRVRQFKVTTFRQEVKEVSDRDHDIEHGTYVAEATVPTVSWFCPTHPDQTMKAFATSQPRCKECKQVMFQGDGAQPIEDL